MLQLTMNISDFKLPTVNGLLMIFVAWGMPLRTAAQSRDINFRNFTYPSIRDEYPAVPSKPRWMSSVDAKLISLRDGQYRYQCGDSPCPLLTLDQVTFGTINGLPASSAIVTTTFHTGGTASWQYVYIVAIQSGSPRVFAWLETGSRADMGLRRVATDHGDLVLTFNDPEKREGDCCSSGTITYRYRWHDASFQQIGQPVLADDPDDAQSAPQLQKPSFDCSKATTPTEELICSDSDLAALDSAMVAAYQRVLRALPGEQKAALRRQHSEWFRQYIRACNATASDNERKECVVQYLSAHTTDLRSKLR